jgi:hypothetical protein
MSAAEQEVLDNTPLVARADLSVVTVGVAQAHAVMQRVISITIASDADYSLAATFASDISAMSKSLDKDRVALKADFLAGCKRIDGYFKTPIDTLDTAFKRVKKVMVAYDDSKRLAREAEERRLTDQRGAAALEAKRLEEAAAQRIRAEEDARREARAAVDAEARRKVEAAEANARAAREAQAAAEATARGDKAAAFAANARAAQAEVDAAVAKTQAAADREAAIEARRKQLKAEAATKAAVETMEAGNQAASVATAAALEGPKELATVGGVARKRVWKFRMKVPLDQVPIRYHCLDSDTVQAVVDRLKDLASDTLGEWFEVTFEDVLAVGKKK